MFAVDGGAQTIYVALGTAIIVSVLAPFVTGLVADRGKRVEADIRRNERIEDNLRQDQVAAQAAQFQRDLIEAQAVQAERLLASTDKIVSATEGTTADVKEIKKDAAKSVHLADGALTASKESQLWALQGKLSSDRLLIAHKTGTDNPPTSVELAGLEATERLIADLEAEVATRKASIEAAASGNTAETPITIDHASITVTEANPLRVESVKVVDPS